MNPNAVDAYFAELAEKFKTGQAREHAHRLAFGSLIKALDLKLNVINDPARSEHGNPDFVFLRGDITAGYAETKDIGVDLDKTEKSEQMERYLGYSNLILTDYLEFRFFKNGSRYGEAIRIGNVTDGKLVPEPKAFNELANALADFLSSTPERIKSGKRLSEIMGGKARRIRDNVRRFFANESDKNAELSRVYQAIKDQLVHDLTPSEFADMYAQTLVYGLFVARHNDDTGDTFSRREAQELVPASNPFLRHFFDHIAGVNFDKRLGYIVDELCDVFRCSNVREIIDQYYENDGAVAGKDQIIHFYEDFLKEYDEALRKKMGAYYTPLPVVRFIVRAIDDILKKEFGLTEGLADTTKLPNGSHKVQVLDPAVGTGTFISEVVRVIYERLLKGGQKGRWPAYVHHDLLPRLHGFELMMAPYTIAHLKLSLAFKKTGFKYFNETKAGRARLGIYLTNSLEQAGPQTEMFSFGFAQSIAEEAKQAAVVKNETPIMVVLGNPPYSVSSSNKGDWIQNLIKDYKKGLDEQNIQPLSDDYIKFIRLAQYFVEKNESGVVAMITNNSFIDGVIHRQMRKNLLEVFDDIYVLDLHGNAKKKEKTQDGEKDENVFDIQQGVAISIFIRKETAREGFGRLHHAELFGSREEKFSALEAGDLKSIKWKMLKYTGPSYFFTPKNLSSSSYDIGFKVDDLFALNSTGIKTHRDDLVIDFEKNHLAGRIRKFSDLSISDTDIASEYGLKNNRDWNLSTARKLVAEENHNELFRTFLYRPYDIRWIYFSSNVIDFDRREVMKHLLSGNNLALVLPRQVDAESNIEVLATNCIGGHKACSAYNINYYFPLYLETGNSWTSNLKKEIVVEIEKVVGKTTPEDIFYYIYATLHSPTYREKYKEFLKIDFPRVPYPKDKKQFAELIALGKELRELHLLESSKINPNEIAYPEEGSNIVEKIAYKGDKVYINAKQYFGNVPEIAWNFYIGGYQPAQKWLKDRKGRMLTNEDIEHYQKIIVTLTETDRIMKEVDKIFRV